jgi:hypothetical protein
MSGKYSAEWWEKIAVIERVVPARQDASSIIDRLIQTTASGRLAPAKDVKRRNLGSAASKEKSSLAG